MSPGLQGEGSMGSHSMLPLQRGACPPPRTGWQDQLMAAIAAVVSMRGGGKGMR